MKNRNKTGGAGERTKPKSRNGEKKRKRSVEEACMAGERWAIERILDSEEAAERGWGRAD